MPTKNMLTTKEATLIADLLTKEQLVCKKARLYSKILTDTAISKRLDDIADSHQNRFNALLGLL